RASGPVRFTAAGESLVAIECGRSKFKFLGLPREEFPSFPAVKCDGAWKAEAGVVHKLVGHVAFAASTEESRPILNGVLWELRPDHMRMVATNGHRLAKMDVPANGGSTAHLILPPQALEQIRRLFAPHDAREIARTDNHISFRAGGALEIGFNAMYLLEILKYMPTDEVRLTFKAPERAATVEPVGWDDPASYMALVMPLRLVD